MLDLLDFVDAAFRESIAVAIRNGVANCVNVADSAVDKTVNIRRAERICKFELAFKAINVP